jgi:hypothetical protein
MSTALSPVKHKRDRLVRPTHGEIRGWLKGSACVRRPGNKLRYILTSKINRRPRKAREAHAQHGFDVADGNADGTGDVPFPTVIVVCADRRVTFADVHVDYTTRTEVPQILDAVDALDAR